MSTNDEKPVYDEQSVYSKEIHAFVSTLDTCLHYDSSAFPREHPVVVYKRMEFFRLMVARGVYSEAMASASSEYPSAASIAAE